MVSYKTGLFNFHANPLAHLDRVATASELVWRKDIIHMRDKEVVLEEPAVAVVVERNRIEVQA